MRLSEIENTGLTLDQIHNNWLKAVSNSQHPPTKQQKDYVYSRALSNQQAKMDPSSAHQSAQNQMMQMSKADYDAQQKTTGKRDFVGAKMGSRAKPDGKVKTGADGRQLRHDRYFTDYSQGKNAKQQMKDKWKEFQKSDGLLGKDVAKGSFIAKGAEKIGKGIVAMGDRARAAAKGSSN